MAIKTPCIDQPCPVLVEGGGRCSVHQRVRTSDKNQSKAGWYNAEWERLRLLKLATDRFCQIRTHCDGEIATEVDHRLPISMHPELRLSWENLQSACKPCNSAKGARERRRFWQNRDGPSGQLVNAPGGASDQDQWDQGDRGVKSGQ